MTKLRLKPGYLVQQVGSEKVLIPCGTGAEVDFSRMIVLNEPGGLIAEKMLAAFVVEEELRAVLMEHYDIGYDRVKQDVKDFLNELEEQGILQKEE